MNAKDVVTNENFYFLDGGKVYFGYVDEKGGYYLSGSHWNGKHYEHDGKNISQLYIPNTINGKPVVGIAGDIFEWLIKVSSIIVEDDNEHLRIYQGGLYSKDMKIMFCMPRNYHKKIFRVPDGVECIFDSALSNKYIETLILPQSCKEILEYGVSSASLKTVYLPKSIEFIGFKAFINTTPEDIYYEGNEDDKKRINFTDIHFNAGIIHAKWHYECKLLEE